MSSRMTEEKADFFHCPAYKLTIEDIRCAVQKSPPHNNVNGAGGEEEEEAEIEWHLRIHELVLRNKKLDLASATPNKQPLELHLKLVWIQGTVLRMEQLENGNLSLVISDEEDGPKEEAVIYEYNTVPGGDHPDIKIGSYIGALGQIWSNEPVVIKATKVMCLSDKPIYKAMWKDEVTLAKAFLAGLIMPSTST